MNVCELRAAIADIDGGTEVLFTTDADDSYRQFSARVTRVLGIRPLGLSRSRWNDPDVVGLVLEGE